MNKKTTTDSGFLDTAYRERTRTQARAQALEMAYRNFEGRHFDENQLFEIAKLNVNFITEEEQDDGA